MCCSSIFSRATGPPIEGRGFIDRPESGLFIPFPKDNLYRTHGKSEMFPELIGQVALVGEMDIFRIIGEADKSGRFDFDLGGKVNLDPLTAP
jgi:hypothetical protein